MPNRLKIPKREGDLLCTGRLSVIHTPTPKYQTASGQSSPNVKELLGFLLLRLIAEQAEQENLQLFDRLLRQLYAGGLKESGS